MKLVKISDITKFGNSLAQSIRANLNWSKQLRKSVILEKAKDSNGQVSISISVGAKGADKSGNPLTGMALAYEFGSGIHRTRGVPQRYSIRPRLKNNLYFISPGYKTPFIGKHVLHPGVAQREFINKSRQAIQARATDELRLAIRKNIIGELNLVIKEINRT